MNVDQIAADGSLVRDVDTKLRAADKDDLLLAALPGATAETYHGVRVVRYDDQILLRAQVHHLGFPWAEFKKRIQIPSRWVEVHQEALDDGLTPRFIGIYRYRDVTIFVDFDPTTYVERKVNNSSAHLATNDLFQAQTLGQFSRQDKNGNRITSVRSDELATYLTVGYEERNPHIEVLDRFSEAFLDGQRVEGLEAVQRMFAAGWPDAFHGEWAGFYVEFSLSRYLVDNDLTPLMIVQKEKRKGEFDYDLRLLRDGALEHYGDLKASNIQVSESPGNDAADFYRCLEEFGRFWYVIVEHETWHGKDDADLPTIAWNEWKQSVGYFDRARKEYSPLSYKSRYKAAVRFVGVKVLEVNQANAHVVLGDFQEGLSQPDGKPRKGKVMIKKRDIDNFLIYTKSIDSVATA